MGSIAFPHGRDEALQAPGMALRSPTTGVLRTGGSVPNRKPPGLAPFSLGPVRRRGCFLWLCPDGATEWGRYARSPRGGRPPRPVGTLGPPAYAVGFALGARTSLSQGCSSSTAISPTGSVTRSPSWPTADCAPDFGLFRWVDSPPCLIAVSPQPASPISWSVRPSALQRRQVVGGCLRHAQRLLPG